MAGIDNFSHEDLLKITQLKRELNPFRIKFRIRDIVSSKSHSVQVLEAIRRSCPDDLVNRSQEMFKRISGLPKDFEVSRVMKMKHELANYNIIVDTKNLVENKEFCMRTLEQAEASCPEELFIKCVNVVGDMGHLDLVDVLSNLNKEDKFMSSYFFRKSKVPSPIIQEALAKIPGRKQSY